MLVLKFGGTSVGSPDRMKAVAELIRGEEPRIVVLSAVSGTTNQLVTIAQCLFRKDNEAALDCLIKLEDEYKVFITELFATQAMHDRAAELIALHFDYLRSFTKDLFTQYEERAVLAQGELISTALFQFYLEELERPSVLLPALDFMRIDKNNEPDAWYIERNIALELKSHGDQQVFVTQGYICRNAYGEIDNLKRGGSDYTASIIGVAVKASEIQIWTDIDGMHNNDPRVVENTKPLEKLSFDEAAELAYFGAKILHPSSVLPARDHGIPVRLKSTMQPDAPGTLISADSSGAGIKAIAAKDGIVALRIKSGRMLLAYGFLRSVFEVFERYKTPIDMITTSEVAVSLTIDKRDNLEEIIKELKDFGSVDVDYDQVIVCVVGDFVQETQGQAAQVFQNLKDIPVRMISYGGSRHNISVLIHQQYRKSALVALSDGLFAQNPPA